MSQDQLTKLQEIQQSAGAAAAIDQLIETLKAEKTFHLIFDALLMKDKFEMGLPVTQPTSFDDVPEDQRKHFEETYIGHARTVGKLFLEDGQIGHAWAYFRTIGEPEIVAEALDKMEARRDNDEETEELINIALYDGANPVKGLEMLLHSHGTCNTVTAMDQQHGQFTPVQRDAGAKLLINELYRDLSGTLRAELEQRMTIVAPNAGVRELIAGRETLFAEGNYHIDVSHLNAVVRFARSLQKPCEELDKAIELAEYGSHLDPQFHYGGEPPFEDFYPAHVHYLNAIAGKNVDQALAYFEQKLEAEPDDQDKMLIASALIDLYLRCEKNDKAAELGREYAQLMEQYMNFSFADLCQKTKRLDLLTEYAAESKNPVSYLAALVETSRSAT